MARRNQRKPKEVEVNVERNSINKADLKKKDVDKKRRDYDAGKDATKCKPGDNDASWYTLNGQLAKDVASLNFAQPLGTKINWAGSPFDGNVTVSEYNQSVAGVAVLRYMPTIGPASGSSADPINVAANSLYTFIRRNVSTYAQYDAPDLMEFILAMDSAYSVYATCVRVYGLMQSYYVYNRYFARPIVNALGFSFDKLQDSLADFRALINQYAFKLAQFCVPAELSFIKRHLWMALNVFYDSDTVKAQTYAYRPDGFYTFVEQTDGPAKLLYKTFNLYADSASDLIDLQGVQNMMNDAILPIMESQDCIAMSGDILRAFGSDKLFIIPAIAETYITSPVMSYEVLSQFENAVCVGTPLSQGVYDGVTYSPDITQRVELDFGGVGLQQSIAFSPGNAGPNTAAGLIIGTELRKNVMLNMHKNDPSVDDVFVATRLTNIPSWVSQYTLGESTVAAYGFQTHGTEIGLFIQCTMFQDISGKWQPSMQDRITAGMIFGSSSANNMNEMARIASIWSQFDWCPTFKYMVTAGTTAYKAYQMQDTDNFEMLTENDLIQMSQVALLSEFSVAGVLEMAAKPVN